MSGCFRLSLSMLGGVLATLSFTSACRADLTFIGSSGNYSAEAGFKLVGTTLTVTLTNTSSTPVSANGDTLGGLFFNTSTTLTAVSAALNTAAFTDANNVVHSGSFTEYGAIKNNVGEGWLYGNGKTVSSKVAGYNSTIAAAGYTMGFKSKAAQPFFKTTVGTSPGGADYSIVGSGGVASKPTKGLKKPLFENSLVFTLTVGSGFSLSDLGNTVRFQMGTNLKETHFEGTLLSVPEPSSLAIAALGAVGFIGCGIRRRAAG